MHCILPLIRSMHQMTFRIKPQPPAIMLTHQHQAYRTSRGCVLWQPISAFVYTLSPNILSFKWEKAPLLTRYAISRNLNTPEIGLKGDHRKSEDLSAISFRSRRAIRTTFNLPWCSWARWITGKTYIISLGLPVTGSRLACAPSTIIIVYTFS